VFYLLIFFLLFLTLIFRESRRTSYDKESLPQWTSIFDLEERGETILKTILIWINKIVGYLISANCGGVLSRASIGQRSSLHGDYLGTWI